MLERETYLSLATYRRDGRSVETAVWFAAEGSSLWVFTARDSGKVKRLRNSPRSRVAACDARAQPIRRLRRAHRSGGARWRRGS